MTRYIRNGEISDFLGFYYHPVLYLENIFMCVSHTKSVFSQHSYLKEDRACDIFL